MGEGRADLIAPVVSAILAALIALGGVYLGLSQEKDIWRQQARLDEIRRLRDRRLDVITDMATALTNAQRASLLDQLIVKHNAKLELEAELCYDSNVREQNAHVCTSLHDQTLDAASAYLEHAAMQAAYLRAFILADVLFCDGTEAVLASVEEHEGAWWEIDRRTQGLLLRTMKMELNCGRDSIEVAE